MYLEEHYYEEVKSEVTKLLRSLGVKHLKKTDSKITVNRKIEVYHVFKTSLELLEKEAIELPQCQSIVEIPVFILDSCRFIEQNVMIEGLFRKAGSTSKQRELRALLDCGSRLNTSDDHDVINVANILKLFLRELPEPLIPYKFHDALIRCLLLKEKKIEAILLICLLYPLEHLNSLAYLMQFLNKVALSSYINKMDVGNLAIIFTPSVMPVNTMKLTPHGGERINHHVQVVKVLIENAILIGVIPESVCVKLDIYGSLENQDVSINHHRVRSRKKKRSSSLTRVLSGIKRIMNKTPPDDQIKSSSPDVVSHTPRIMSSKKRKANNTPVNIKKKTEILNLLPSGTPLSSTKQSSKPKDHVKIVCDSRIQNGTPEENKYNCTVNVPLSINNTLNIQVDEDVTEKMDTAITIASTIEVSFSNKSPEEFVRIPKAEYETIKERVAQIESRIENEFCNTADASIKKFNCMENSTCLKNENEFLNVEKAYLHTVEKVGKFEESSGSELSKQYYKNLNLRRSLESPAIRSPSARRIGSIKRRSRDSEQIIGQSLSFSSFDRKKPHIQSCPISCNLKRGRPNTVFSGLTPPCATTLSCKDRIPNNIEALANTSSEEKRINAESCFKPLNTLESKPSKSDAVEWENASIFFSNPIINKNILPSARDSLIKIRNQNVGMVLAKAKIFDPSINQFNSNNVDKQKNSFNKNSNLSDLNKEPDVNIFVNHDSCIMSKVSQSACNIKITSPDLKRKIPNPSFQEDTDKIKNRNQNQATRMPFIKQTLNTPSPRRLAEINKLRRPTPIKLFKTPV